MREELNDSMTKTVVNFVTQFHAVFVSIPLKDMPTVIEAIEKQTAKKPQLIGDGYADGCIVYDFWKCPFCENSFEVDFQEYDYCPNCGQKIDWRVPDDSASETE